MDILIKNMEMPKSCRECRFHSVRMIWQKNVYLHKCYAQMVAEEADGEDTAKLPMACPLVEVKEAKTGKIYPAESKMWVEANNG